MQQKYDLLNNQGELAATHQCLKSAYCEAGATGNRIYTRFFIGPIDYIFYSSVERGSTAQLELVSVLSLPDVEDVRKTDGYLPSNRFPSDHLRLEAVF